MSPVRLRACRHMRQSPAGTQRSEIAEFWDRSCLAAPLDIAGVPLDNGGVVAKARADVRSTSDLEARVEAEGTGRPFLLYRDGDGRQQLFCFAPDAERLSVGRQPSSDLLLAWDTGVSRLHA